MKTFKLGNYTLGLILILSAFFVDAKVIRSADYTIRGDDKLRIQIYQYPDLTGEYIVSSSGTISVGPIGELSVIGLSAQEVAARISDRFISAGLSDKPGTAVTVLQSRPIYVLGDVQRPGEYSYRTGMTVLQAISLSGGFYRVTDPGLLRIEREAITTKGDLRTHLRRYFHLIARRARLIAEMELRSDVAFPSELTRQAKGDQALAQVMAEEQAFLQINVDALKRQLESLEKTRGLYEREIESVSEQISANKKEAASVQRELNDVRTLYGRGLATISRQSGLERTQAQIAVAEQGFQTLILRARQNITQVEQRIFDLQNERRGRLNAELQRTRLDLEEALNRIDTNKSLLVEVQFTAPILAANTEDFAETRSFQIVRPENGKQITFAADEHMELQPGDVVKVQRTYPLPSGLKAASARRSEDARSLDPRLDPVNLMRD